VITPNSRPGGAYSENFWLVIWANPPHTQNLPNYFLFEAKGEILRYNVGVSKKGKMDMMDRKSIRVSLDGPELWDLKRYCLDNKKSMQNVVRGLILDAIAKDKNESKEVNQ